MDPYVVMDSQVSRQCLGSVSASGGPGRGKQEGPLMDIGILLQQISNGLTLGAMYALVALGYTLVYGIIELINFAHGDVFMFSTVIVLIVVQNLRITEPV